MDEDENFEPYECMPLPFYAENHYGIVESTTLSNIHLPNCNYPITETLKTQIKNRLLTNIQFEGVICALYQFQKILPDGKRAGFLLGDGMGVGKGRQSAAIIIDTMARGCKRCIWVSKNPSLMNDANRDFSDLETNIRAFHANFTEDMDGVAFTSYSFLLKKVKLVIDWFGRTNDGVIVLDECQLASTNSSETCAAIKHMQDELPFARFLYVSATSMNTIAKSGYLCRLGLYGKGTHFPDFKSFVKQFHGNNLAALEMLACSLKSSGRRVVRLSQFANIRFEVKKMDLSIRQMDQFESISAFIRKIFEWSELADEYAAKASATNSLESKSGYWHMQFGGMAYDVMYYYLASLKIDTIVSLTEQALKNNQSVVIGISNTGESSLKDVKGDQAEFENVIKRIISRFLHSDKQTKFPLSINPNGIGELSPSPEEISFDLVLLVKRILSLGKKNNELDSALVQKVCEYTAIPFDKDNPGFDSKGMLYKCIAMRNDLLRELDGLDLPPSNVDLLMYRLGGPTKVAELTGRKRRQIKDKNGIVTTESRNDLNNDEVINFQSGKKRIVLVSKSCSIGISLHSDRNVLNQQQRFHITMDINPDVTSFVQQLGRTNRTNQAVPPVYCIIETGIPGEARLSAIINHKMKSLGALTRGNRNACVEIPSIKMDSIKPLQLLFEDVETGDVTFGPDSVNIMKWIHPKEKPPTLRQFLNKVLCLDLEHQRVLMSSLNASIEQLEIDDRIDGTSERRMTNIETSEISIFAQPRTFFVDAKMHQPLVLHSLIRDRGLSWEKVLRECVYRICQPKHPHLIRSNVPMPKDNVSIKSLTNKNVNFFLSHADNICMAWHIYDNKWGVVRPKTGLGGIRIVDNFTNMNSLIKRKDSSIRKLWESEYENEECVHGKFCTAENCDAGRRFVNMNVLTGFLLPHWSNLEKMENKKKEKGQPRKHLRVIKTVVEGRSIIGVLTQLDASKIVRAIGNEMVKKKKSYHNAVYTSIHSMDHEKQLNSYGLMWNDEYTITHSDHKSIPVGFTISSIDNVEPIIITTYLNTNEPLEIEPIKPIVKAEIGRKKVKKEEEVEQKEIKRTKIAKPIPSVVNIKDESDDDIEFVEE